MSRSYGKKHGGKLTRIVLGIDEGYASFLDGAVKKGKGISAGINNGGRGFSPKKPNSKIEVVEPSSEPKVLMKEGVWMVPVEDRPKGWEEMGGKEIEDSKT